MGEGYNNSLIAISLILALAIITSAIIYNAYDRRAKFQTNLNAINDTTMKCIYLCGEKPLAQYGFEAYKLCIEKCDRVNERQILTSGGLNGN